MAVRRRVDLLATVLALAAVATACGGSGTFPDDAIAIRASSDLGVGPERLLIGVGDIAGARLGSPEDMITLEVAPLDDLTTVRTYPATFTWVLEDVVGLYRADVEFDRAGVWQAIVVPEEGDPLEPVAFNVFSEPFTPVVGAPVPLAPTPTLDDLPLDELTTDLDPDLRFYQTSLVDAVASGMPTVVVFSTPAYCQTSACGPVLEVVKGVAQDYPAVNFIHVEVYTGLNEPDFRPDPDHWAPAITEQWFNLPTEPWVFVVDGSGIVAAKFEGVLDGSELRDVLG